MNKYRITPANLDSMAPRNIECQSIVTSEDQKTVLFMNGQALVATVPIDKYVIQLIPGK